MYADLTHEYGHYIEQEVLGNEIYAAIAFLSIGRVNSAGHMSESYESLATQLGIAYVANSHQYKIQINENNPLS